MKLQFKYEFQSFIVGFRITFSVMVPSGEILNSGELAKVCEFSISGNTLCVDLIILKMHDYDVILGMDWLSKHYAKIDCKKNKVTFRPPQKESFKFKR